MKRTVQTSLMRASIGGIALGLTLVVGIGHVAYADDQGGQQVSTAAGPGAQAGGSTPSPTHVTFERPYTPPSGDGGGSLSNTRQLARAGPPAPNGGVSLPERADAAGQRMLADAQVAHHVRHLPSCCSLAIRAVAPHPLA